MVEQVKGRLLLTGVYADGTPLCEEKPLQFVASLREIETTSFKEIRLRLLVPAREAEELFTALTQGVAEINVEHVPTLVGRNS